MRKKVTVLLSTSLAWPPNLAASRMNFNRNLAPTFLHNPVDKFLHHKSNQVSLPLLLQLLLGVRGPSVVLAARAEPRARGRVHHHAPVQASLAGRTGQAADPEPGTKTVSHLN